MPKIRVEYLSDTRDASEFFDSVEDAIDWLEDISVDDDDIEEDEDIFEEVLHNLQVEDCIPGSVTKLGAKTVSVSNLTGSQQTIDWLIENNYEITYRGKTGNTWELKS